MFIIPLPDLEANPKIVQQTIIEQKTYTFSYRWMDEDYCLLDILLGSDFLVQGKPMVTGSNLVGRVKNDDLIAGALILQNKYGLSIPPSQENFSKDYYLVWIPA